MFEVGETYEDKRGWKVEVIYVLVTGTHPIIGIARYGEKEEFMVYTKDGVYFNRSEPSDYDLIQPEKSAYVVELENGVTWRTYDDKESAIKYFGTDNTKKIYRYVRKEQIK